MGQRLVAALAFCFAAASAQAEVYLMARGKIDGTDLVTVDFLSDPRMATLDACEAERRAARTTGFEIFRRVYVAKHRGFSSHLQTYCVESEQRLSPFRGQAQTVSYAFLVEVNGQKLRLTAFPDLGACQDVGGRGNQQSATRFCARSRQQLR